MHSYHPQSPLFSSLTTNSNCTTCNEEVTTAEEDAVTFSQIARDVVEQQRTVDYYMRVYNQKHEYHPE